MKVRVINSGSIGNCYLFEAKHTTLIVECGVRFSQVKEALRFDLSRVVGCIVTHEHKDHCIGVKDAIAHGINVYCSKGTADAMGINSHRIKTVEARKIFTVGDFQIMPFDVKHDCKQPFGFLINHAECGLTLFVTDSYYVTNTFKGLNNILVEANYSERILNERLLAGKLHGFVRDRVLKSHLSLENCISLLQANDLSKVNNIVLIHLSDGNADEKMFQKAVRGATGKTVHIATKGLLIDLNKTPF